MFILSYLSQFAEAVFVVVDGGWSNKRTTDKMAAITTTQATKKMHIYMFNLLQLILLMCIKGSLKEGTFTLCDVISRGCIILPIRHELGCTGRYITGL